MTKEYITLDGETGLAVELPSVSAARAKADKIKQFRAEASKLASKANKRIERLEKNNLKDTPAYQQYIKAGGKRFGVRGKTYNEVQQELSRLRKFIDSETSTVRGAYRTLKEMAENTGIKYKNLNELKTLSPKFFELSSKVEQYLRTVDDMASAIGYQQIWEAINEYVQENKIDLGDTEANLDGMIKQVTDLVKENTHQNEPVVMWYAVKDKK